MCHLCVCGGGGGGGVGGLGLGLLMSKDVSNFHTGYSDKRIMCHSHA